MATFGDTNVEAGDDSGNAAYHIASRFQANGNGTVTSILLWIQSGTGHVNLAIYSDNAGAPNALLGSGTSTSVTGPAWCGISGFNVAITNGTYYWLTFTCDADALHQRRAAGVANQEAYKANIYGSFPNPFGAPVYGAFYYSIYATYTPSAKAKLILLGHKPHTLWENVHPKL